MSEVDYEKKVSLEFFRQAGEYVKASIYCSFFVNGGAITAILAKTPLEEVTLFILFFVSGLICSIISFVTAYLTAYARASEYGAICNEAKKAVSKIYKVSFNASAFFGCLSAAFFFLGCACIMFFCR